MSLNFSITPRPNQTVSRKAMVSALETGDCAPAHLACGPGKTYLQAFLAGDMIQKADRAGPMLVCLVPMRN